MKYQRGTIGMNLESDHSETEVLCPDSTQQKIKGRQNFWGQATPLHYGNRHPIVIRETYEHYSGRYQRKVGYQRSTSGINLENDHSETEAHCPDATHQKIQGRQNVWGQTTQLHDGNRHP